jgi:hypothetical protein
MEQMKRFVFDESATAEASSSVTLVAAVGLLLSAALVVYYGAMGNFFTNVADTMRNFGSSWANDLTG